MYKIDLSQRNPVYTSYFIGNVYYSSSFFTCSQEAKDIFSFILLVEQNFGMF